MRVRHLLMIAAAVVVAAGWGATTTGQAPPSSVEWRSYGGDSSSTRYSPINQINAQNVKDLRIVWRWKADNFGTAADYNWEATPLMANGVLYITAGTHRDVVATRRPARLSPSSSSRPARPE